MILNTRGRRKRWRLRSPEQKYLCLVGVEARVRRSAERLHGPLHQYLRICCRLGMKRGVVRVLMATWRWQPIRLQNRLNLPLLLQLSNPGCQWLSSQHVQQG